VTPPAHDGPACTAAGAPGRGRPCDRPAAYLVDCRCPREPRHGDTVGHCPAHAADARAGAMHCGHCADAGHDMQPITVASLRSLPPNPRPTGPAIGGRSGDAALPDRTPDGPGDFWDPTW
jgi:hypothetical protein